MKGDEIPPADHVCRYCGGSHIDEDGNVDGAAFQLRNGEPYLSVNWLEYLDHGSRSAQISQVIEAFLAKDRSLGATAKFAVLNVGTVSDVARQELTQLQAVHEPEDGDPSHSGIYGYSHHDDIIADLIAERCISELLSTK